MNGEKGATLMEVLIALSITAMLAAAVTQMTGFGLRVVERGERASSGTAAALSDERALRDALTGARGAFTGDASGFQWRGGGPEDAASWRLDIKGRIAACAGNECGPPRPWLGAPVSSFAYAGPDGVFADEWANEAPPHLIRIGLEDREIIVAPRIRGAE
ncbi:MAG: prepilin-type N-terminal cleavage/methylation domain-containing protein [Pseudomonadota bacterium]